MHQTLEVHCAASADETENFVAFLEKKFRKIRAILPCDAGY